MRNVTVRSGRAELAATVAGDGRPALIFLHAGVADKRMWQHQLEAFAPMHRVVAYDRRGFGDTRYEAESYSHLEDLAAVIAATADDPAVLVGCSQGGRIAIDFALAYPRRVARLVLVAPAVSGAPEPEDHPPAIEPLIEAYEAAERDKDVQRLNAIEAHAWLDGPAQREGRVTGPVRDLFLDMNGRALAAVSPGEETGKTDAFARFGELDMPILFVLGALDFPHVNERIRHLAGAATRAWVVELPGTAHLPPSEIPNAFNDLLRAELRG